MLLMRVFSYHFLSLSQINEWCLEFGNGSISIFLGKSLHLSEPQFCLSERKRVRQDDFWGLLLFYSTFSPVLLPQANKFFPISQWYQGTHRWRISTEEICSTQEALVKNWQGWSAGEWASCCLLWLQVLILWSVSLFPERLMRICDLKKKVVGNWLKFH